MKRILTLALAAGMLFGAATGARAIDFKASGEWLVGFGAGDGSLLESTRDVGQKRSRADSDDIFNAGQRFRLQLDAVASESLSGTVFFEIGDQFWGRSGEGASLGADGTNVIKVKNAYLDWLVPNTDLRLRMGLQAIAMPNVAGGSAILAASCPRLRAASTAQTRSASSDAASEPSGTSHQRPLRASLRAPQRGSPVQSASPVHRTSSHWSSSIWSGASTMK